MELIFRICLSIAGVINLIPALLVFVPEKIKSSYGIEVPDVNYELLLRHRAILFGIIGGIMIHSAITKKNYSFAVSIGLISMISFIILFNLVNGEVNPELRKVYNIDIIAVIILLFGFIMYKFS